MKGVGESTWPKTTQFDPALPVFKNLVKRCQVSGRNQVWVADITYVRTQEALGLRTPGSVHDDEKQV